MSALTGHGYSGSWGKLVLPLVAKDCGWVYTLMRMALRPQVGERPADGRGTEVYHGASALATKDRRIPTSGDDGFIPESIFPRSWGKALISGKISLSNKGGTVSVPPFISEYRLAECVPICGHGCGLREQRRRKWRCSLLQRCAVQGDFPTFWERRFEDGELRSKLRKISPKVGKRRL